MKSFKTTKKLLNLQPNAPYSFWKIQHLQKKPQNLTVWSHPGAQQSINLLSSFLISTIDNNKDALGQLS